MTDPSTSEPTLNRAGRRAESRRLRKAGALMAAIPAAFGTTALVVGATAGTAGAGTLTVNSLGDAGDGTCDASPGECTLRDALDDATDGDTIDFETGLTGTINLTGQLEVSDSVTISGPGMDVITVDAGGADRIFNVSTEGGANGSFTVSGLTLANGTDGGGGAINNANEDITISGVRFTGNTSTGGGGAIHSVSPDVDIEITDSEFTDNEADDEGGAIKFTDGASLTITGTSFTGNDSGQAGGAIYAYDFDGPATISGSTFEDNTAEDSGGAAVIWNSPGVARIETSRFAGNSSGNKGGALYLYKLVDVTIAGSEFVDNTAAGDGGAVRVYLGTATIEDSTFTGNEATDDDGGALYLGYAEGPTTIAGSTFADNYAGDDGGGVVWYYGSAPLELRNSTFSGNTAASTGGGLYIAYPAIEAATASVFNSTFSGNTAESGGGITVTSYYDVEIVQVTVTDNTAASGAGIYLPDSSEEAVEVKDAPGRSTPADDAPRAKSKEPYAATVSGTIVAANNGVDVEGAGILTAASSLLGSIVDTTLVDGGGNLQGVDPLLGPLQDNGGPTQTHALLDGSPAINAGPDPLTPFPGSDDDQRGPGYARVIGGRVDIGAFEVQTTAIEPNFTG